MSRALIIHSLQREACNRCGHSLFCPPPPPTHTTTCARQQHQNGANHCSTNGPTAGTRLKKAHFSCLAPHKGHARRPEGFRLKPTPTIAFWPNTTGKQGWCNGGNGVRPIRHSAHQQHSSSTRGRALQPQDRQWRSDGCEAPRQGTTTTLPFGSLVLGPLVTDVGY